MIPLNTLCLIVWTDSRPEVSRLLGSECTITASFTAPAEHYYAKTKAGIDVCGPRKCFMPLQPFQPMPVQRKEVEQ